jgi:tol-pal system-associated acyl-CoA thioesterase
MTKAFSIPLRVYIEDTDAGGIVFYVNYLKFMERARTEGMRFLGFGKDHTLNHSAMFVVRSAQISYLRSAELDDELRVSFEPTEVRGAAFTVRQRVYRDDDLLADAVIECVCVSRERQKPVRLASGIRNGLMALMQGV